MKRLLRFAPASAALGWLIWAYMALCARTIRWRVEGDDGAKAAWARGGGVIVAAWHGQIALLPAGWIREMRHWPGRRGPAAMIISLSPDGEPVAHAIRHLGLESVRGSSAHKRKRKDNGGGRALADAVRRLRAGGAVCITPDGPRGPRQVSSLGPILLAKRSGAAILPYAVASAPAKRFKTWDRFTAPLPFSRGAIVFGPPLEMGRGDDAEAQRQTLEDRLMAATRRADALSGRAPKHAQDTREAIAE